MPQALSCARRQPRPAHPQPKDLWKTARSKSLKVQDAGSRRNLAENHRRNWPEPGFRRHRSRREVAKPLKAGGPGTFGSGSKRLCGNAAVESRRGIFGIPAADPVRHYRDSGGQERRPGARKEPSGRPVRISEQSPSAPAKRSPRRLRPGRRRALAHSRMRAHARKQARKQEGPAFEGRTRTKAGGLPGSAKSQEIACPPPSETVNLGCDFLNDFRIIVQIQMDNPIFTRETRGSRRAFRPRGRSDSSPRSPRGRNIRRGSWPGTAGGSPRHRRTRARPGSRW